jgi:hypothetical protein
MTATFGRGAKGDLVSVLQRGLLARGFYTGQVDADFGGATKRAVETFQEHGARPVTGQVGPDDWEEALGLPWPELFARCLQLTARFEGHGYGTVAGNFDGAGLTWGVIGFTLQHGGLASLVLEVDARAPEVLEECFGDASAELLGHLREDTAADRLAWADSISLPPRKVGVAEPWRSGFRRLGAAPLTQELQRREARRKYFEPALSTAGRLGLASDRGIALCFDVHVQNGGVKKKSANTYSEEVASLPDGAPERDRRSILARLVADSSRPQFRDDVLSRKSCIATGRGAVHGETFDLDAWALDDG